MSAAAEWTDAEYGHIQETLNRPAREVALDMGKSRAAVYAARKRVISGWARERPTRWTKEEDAAILTGSNLTAAGLSKLIPSRSPKSVAHRRSHLSASVVFGAQKSPHNPVGRTLIAKTCRKCGMLLPGKWFGSYKDGAESICRKCAAAKTSVNVMKRRARGMTIGKYALFAQSLSLKTATKHRYEYTEDDHKVLSDPLMTNLEKALVLRRTYIAVAGQVTRNGYGTRPHLTNPSHEQWRIDNPNADRIEEITAALKQEFTDAGIQFPEWGWDDDDLKEAA